jgi:hypothetical protein
MHWLSDLAEIYASFQVFIWRGWSDIYLDISQLILVSGDVEIRARFCKKRDAIDTVGGGADPNHGQRK